MRVTVFDTTPREYALSSLRDIRSLMKTYAAVGKYPAAKAGSYTLTVQDTLLGPMVVLKVNGAVRYREDAAVKEAYRLHVAGYRFQIDTGRHHETYFEHGSYEPDFDDRLDQTWYMDILGHRHQFR